MKHASLINTGTSDTTSTQRIHALDALRAAMMLLGLVLHACVSYAVAPLGRAWWYRDPSTHGICDLIVVFIHVFRMPIFFVMAGFFAAMLYERGGAMGLVRNRAARILVPFVVGWIVLVPPTVTGFHFANTARDSSIGEGLAAVWTGALDGKGLYANTTIHLWFLYYLLMFYAVGIALVPAARRLPDSWRARARSFFAGRVQSPWRPLWFAVPTALTLYLMKTGAMRAPGAFIPTPQVVLAYGVFFGFGWLLYAERDLVPAFQRKAWWQIALALLLMPVNMIAVRSTAAALPRYDVANHALAVTTGALIVWLLVFGITGVFLKPLDRPRPVVRYVVDAAYWIYLIHLPLVIWVTGLLSGLEWPAGVKLLLVLGLSAPILILSYDFCVRNTLIGRVLNGRRYPRGLPSV